MGAGGSGRGGSGWNGNPNSIPSFAELLTPFFFLDIQHLKFEETLQGRGPHTCRGGLKGITEIRGITPLSSSKLLPPGLQHMLFMCSKYATFSVQFVVGIWSSFMQDTFFYSGTIPFISGCTITWMYMPCRNWIIRDEAGGNSHDCGNWRNCW